MATYQTYILIQSICNQYDKDSSTQENTCCNRKDFSFLLKGWILSIFLNVIWHLIVESNSHIHHTFPGKDCIAKLYSTSTFRNVLWF